MQMQFDSDATREEILSKIKPWTTKPSMPAYVKVEDADLGFRVVSVGRKWLTVLTCKGLKKIDPDTVTQAWS